MLLVMWHRLLVQAEKGGIMINTLCLVCIIAIPLAVIILMDISSDLSGIRTELRKIREEKEVENERFWRLKYDTKESN